MQQAGKEEKRDQSRRLVVLYGCVKEEALMSKTHTCGAFVHDPRNAAKCDTGAPASQATCTVGERMKYVHCSETHVLEA